MMRIDLNADVVEGYDDRALLPFLTSVNIACGGHAGDEPTMAAIVRAAEALGLALGAHPSYPDRQHFGRREMAMEPTALGSALRAQVTALVEVAAAAGSRLVHVKPHGARYNTAARDLDTVRVVARAIAEVDPTLRLVGLGGSRLLEAGREVGLGVAGEAADQAVRIVLDHEVLALDGTRVAVFADTLCIHGDTDGAVAIAAVVRRRLEQAGVVVFRL